MFHLRNPFYKREEPIQIERAPVVEKKSSTFALGTSESLGSFLILGTGRATTAASALSLYRKSTAVSVPVNRIAEAIATMDFVLEEEDGTIINNHPVLDLIRAPSPFYTKRLFIEKMAKDYLITNESEIVALGGITRPPLELQPISPDHLTVPEGGNGLPTSHIISGGTMDGIYKAERDRGTVRYIRDVFTEAYLIRGYNTRDNSLLRGESLLASASSEVREDILGGEHNVSLLEKGGRVSLIFNFKDELEGDDFKVMKERIRAEYGGASKAGQIAITTGDVDIKEVGINNKDMEFSLLQKMARIAVANQYGYPLVLLDTDAATLNNYQTGKEALSDDASIPVANVLMGGLSLFLLPRYNLDPSKVRIVPDLDSITALTMRRNKELKLRKEIGIETTNELRSFLPNRSDAEGADKILVPANMIPIESAGASMMDANPSAFPEKRS